MQLIFLRTPVSCHNSLSSPQVAFPFSMVLYHGVGMTFNFCVLSANSEMKWLYSKHPVGTHERI
jgi:hypothetical protein